MTTEVATLSIVTKCITLAINTQYLHFQKREKIVKMLNSDHSQKDFLINQLEAYFPSISQTSLHTYKVPSNLKSSRKTEIKSFYLWTRGTIYQLITLCTCFIALVKQVFLS